MKHAYPIALLALATMHAEDCSLRGVALSTADSPVPGVEISLAALRLFHGGGGARTTTTEADGSFSFADLPCGKYVVSAYGSNIEEGFPVPVTVDIRKQPAIQLKIPNVDPLAGLLYVPEKKSALRAASLPGAPAASTAQEDPAISVLRREYFGRLAPEQLATFDAAPVPEKKRMYALAVTAHMMGMEAGDSARPPEQRRNRSRWSILRVPASKAGVPGIGSAATFVPHAEEDSIARRQLARAAAVIREALSPADAEAFSKAPEIERARIFLRAAAALPSRHPAACGMYGLMVADLPDSAGGQATGYMTENLLDDPGAGQWASSDTAGRCRLLDRAAQKMLGLAKRLEADGSVENVKSVLVVTGDPARAPQYSVLEAFGNGGLKHYREARSVDSKLELFRASLLMALCWTAVYTAM